MVPTSTQTHTHTQARVHTPARVNSNGDRPIRPPHHLPPTARPSAVECVMSARVHRARTKGYMDAVVVLRRTRALLFGGQPVLRHGSFTEPSLGEPCHSGPQAAPEDLSSFAVHNGDGGACSGLCCLPCLRGSCGRPVGRGELGSLRAQGP